MTIPTNTWETYDTKGIREDLKDVIYNVDPTDTPFLSMVRHTDASNTLVEWQTDSLASAANNAALEGDDAPQDAVSATTRLGNYTQISTKDARVSGTNRSVDAAGRADELSYQMLKRGRELKRDMETALLSNKAKVVGDSTTARELAGLPSWIVTNINYADDDTDAQSATGDGTDARTDGDQRAFAYAQLQDVAQQVFDSGGNPDVLMVGAYNRTQTSLFATSSNIRVQMQRMDDEVLRTSFEVIATDFSTLKIVPNRFQRARDAFVLQTDMWGVAFLPGRNMRAFDIAKTGDSDARQILSEYTLLANNEKSSGAIYDLTTAPATT